MSDRTENPLEWVTTWCTTTTDQDQSLGADEGRVQVQADGENVPGRVEQLSLPGHYAVARTGVSGLMLRLERGGWMVSSWTQPPSDATVGEAGLIGPDSTAPVVARVLPGALGDFFETKGGRVIDTVILCSDAPLGTLYVARSTDPVATPLGVCVGTIQATSVKVKAG